MLKWEERVKYGWRLLIFPFGICVNQENESEHLCQVFPCWWNKLKLVFEALCWDKTAQPITAHHCRQQHCTDLTEKLMCADKSTYKMYRTSTSMTSMRWGERQVHVCWMESQCNSTSVCRSGKRRGGVLVNGQNKGRWCPGRIQSTSKVPPKQGTYPKCYCGALQELVTYLGFTVHFHKSRTLPVTQKGI